MATIMKWPDDPNYDDQDPEVEMEGCAQCACPSKFEECEGLTFCSVECQDLWHKDDLA